MRTQVATDAGSSAAPSEDRVLVSPSVLVVLDGATARTGTGCIHGVAWYADQLATAVMGCAHLGPAGALTAAISRTAAMHRDTCDLRHPGTPSAAVGIVQVEDDRLRYLVLGDVTIVVDAGPAELVVSDARVDGTAQAERAEADALPAGSPEKAAALVRMKHAELAARNTAGGYWIAAAEPNAVEHALIGEVPLAEVRRAAILTDGAARVVDLFQLCDWPEALAVLATDGPRELINRVRSTEASDPRGERWPRNKVSDDATVVYCDAFPGASDGTHDRAS